jgi:hypothetical protein
MEPCPMCNRLKHRSDPGYVIVKGIPIKKEVMRRTRICCEHRKMDDDYFGPFILQCMPLECGTWCSGYDASKLVKYDRVHKRMIRLGQCKGESRPAE